MLNKYSELKKPLIGLALSVAMLIGLIVYVVALRKNNPSVPISQASITITDVTVNQSSVRIDWQCDNAGVTSYQIFRKENAQSNWKYYDSVSYHTKYYIDSNASNGNTYGYYVRAYDSRKTTSNSSYSSYIYIYTDFGSYVNLQDISEIKPQLDATTTGDKVTLSWKPIANVPLTSICVYYKNKNGGWEIAKVLPPNIFSYEEIKRSNEYKIVGRNFSGLYELRTAETIIAV